MAREESETVLVWRAAEAMRITGCSLRQANDFAKGTGDLRKLERIAKMIDEKGGDKLLALQIV